MEAKINTEQSSQKAANAWFAANTERVCAALEKTARILKLPRPWATWEHICKELRRLAHLEETRESAALWALQFFSHEFGWRVLELPDNHTARCINESELRTRLWVQHQVEIHRDTRRPEQFCIRQHRHTKGSRLPLWYPMKPGGTFATLIEALVMAVEACPELVEVEGGAE